LSPTPTSEAAAKTTQSLLEGKN